MAEIRNYCGRPCIFIEGKPYPPMMATIRTNARDHMEVDKEYYRQLGAAGIKIYFLICDTVWLKPQALEQFRYEAEILLSVCPDAYIIPRIGCHPNNEWIAAHPAETLTYSDGSRPGCHLFTESYETDIPAHYMLCSNEWRHDAGIALGETWDMLMSLPYADHIVGCFLAAGGTSEWYYMLPPERSGLRAGYCKAFREQFTHTLTEKYGTDEALRKSWKKDGITLADAPLPAYEKSFFASEAERTALNPPIRMYSNTDVPEPPKNGYNVGTFVDLDTATDIFDFYRTWHAGTAESVLYFANVIKTHTPDRLVGAFYGSWGCTNVVSSGTAGGTLKLLDSPLIDFLAAPGVYENRQPGGFVGQREMNDSFTIRNKIYIIEDDSRTHHENRWNQPRYGMFDLTDSIDVLKREFGRTLCEGVQAWWFDQLLGGRRYKDPEIYKLFARQQEIAAEYVTKPAKRSEIAYIYDEESGQAAGTWTTHVTVEAHRNYEIAHVGTPVDQYFHNDMSRPDFPHYKMYVFFNCFYLTDEEREQIHAVLKRDHATAVWIYASGLLNPDAEKRVSAENVTALTGIQTVLVDQSFDPKMRFDGDTSTYFDGIDNRTVYGTFSAHRMTRDGTSANDYALYPLLMTADPAATVAAHFVTSNCISYLDEQGGELNHRPAVTVKECDGFTSIFYAAKYIPANLVRSIAKGAGVHVYSDDGDVFFACENYVTVHASTIGQKTIRFPRPCSPFELYEQKTYAENVTEISFPMRLGETKMFELR